MLEQLTTWWTGFLALFDNVPEMTIAITVYVGGTLIALWAWYGIARRLPQPFGTLTWIILFALLATPTVSDGANASFAPAIIGVIFGILTKENYLIYSNLASILLVIGVICLLCFFWKQYQNREVK